MKTWNQTFKEAFCEHFSCSPEFYEVEAMRQFCFPHARPFIWLLWLFRARSIQGALTLVQRIGNARNYEEVLNEGISYRDWLKLHGSFAANVLKMRISLQRILRVIPECCGDRVDLQRQICLPFTVDRARLYPN